MRTKETKKKRKEIKPNARKGRNANMSDYWTNTETSILEQPGRRSLVYEDPEQTGDCV